MSDSAKIWRTGRTLFAASPDTEDVLTELSGSIDEKESYGTGAPGSSTPGVKYYKTDSVTGTYIKQKGSSTWTLISTGS